jgi:hypothetical protein
VQSHGSREAIARLFYFNARSYLTGHKQIGDLAANCQDQVKELEIRWEIWRA